MDASFRARLSRHQVDVTVLGLSGPGSKDQPWLAALSHATGALALTDSHEGSRLATCVRAGVRSLALRNISVEDLVAGIHLVAAGEVFLGAGAVEAMMREMARLSVPDPAPLTARELEVLRMLAQGLNAPAIAAALTVERSTVKTHLHHAFAKLGVSNQAAAVAEAMRRGLLG